MQREALLWERGLHDRVVGRGEAKRRLSSLLREGNGSVYEDGGEGDHREAVGNDPWDELHIQFGGVGQAAHARQDEGSGILTLVLVGAENAVSM